MKYDDHPLAAIFPLMSDAELGELAEDIRANGLREDVWLYEDLILDGRNRYRACLTAEQAPRFKEFKGKDPLAFVISKNLHRRHLDASQRAMVAAELANGKHGRNQHKQGGPANLPVLTQPEAAEAFNVSERSIRDASAVKDDGVPELVEAVKSGEVPVSTAAKVAKLPKAQQRKAVKGGKKSVQEAAKQATKQADDEAPDGDPSEVFCSTINVLCRDIDAIVARVEALKESPFGPFVHTQSAISQLKGARETLHGGRPTHECPYCAAAGETQPKCRCCRGLGVCTKSSYRSGTAAVGGRK